MEKRIVLSHDLPRKDKIIEDTSRTLKMTLCRFIWIDGRVFILRVSNWSRLHSINSKMSTKVIIIHKWTRESKFTYHLLLWAITQTWGVRQEWSGRLNLNLCLSTNLQSILCRCKNWSQSRKVETKFLLSFCSRIKVDFWVQ